MIALVFILTFCAATITEGVDPIWATLTALAALRATIETRRQK